MNSHPSRLDTLVRGVRLYVFREAAARHQARGLRSHWTGFLETARPQGLTFAAIGSRGILELEAQTQLHDPPGVRRRDAAKGCGAGLVTARVREVGAVEGVENIPPQLKRAAFAHRRLLVQRQVEPHQPWTGDDVAPGCTVQSWLAGPKNGRVEPALQLFVFGPA